MYVCKYVCISVCIASFELVRQHRPHMYMQTALALSAYVHRYVSLSVQTSHAFGSLRLAGGGQLTWGRGRLCWGRGRLTWYRGRLTGGRARLTWGRGRLTCSQTCDSHIVGPYPRTRARCIYIHDLVLFDTSGFVGAAVVVFLSRNSTDLRICVVGVTRGMTLGVVVCVHSLCEVLISIRFASFWCRCPPTRRPGGPSSTKTRCGRMPMCVSRHGRRPQSSTRV